MIVDFDIHHASRRLAVRHQLADGSICGRVYDLASGDLVGEITPRYRPQGLRFSPDGLQVSFFGDGSLYVYDIPRQAVELVFHQPPLHAGFCEWSPAGDALVFSAYAAHDKGHPPDLYLLNRRTQALTQLTDTPEVDRLPQWSPSGEYVAFQRQSVRDGGQHERIHVVHIHTLESTGYLPNPAASYTLGRNCWIPDTPYLLALERIDQKTGVVVMSAESGKILARREVSGLRGVGRGIQGRAALAISTTTMDLLSLPSLAPLGRVALPDGIRPFQGLNGPTAVMDETERTIYWAHSQGLYQWTDAQGHTALLHNIEPKPAFHHEEYTVRSSDGRKIPTHRLVPPNPHSMGVVYVFGGPEGSINLEDAVLLRLLAEGYEVICPVYRGKSGYGVEHQEANRSAYGQADVGDVVAVARDWRHRTGSDRRLALVGFSYGGYLTWLSLAAADIWACGISLWGVTRLEYMGPHLARAYPQDPAQLAQAQVERSPMVQASRIRAPLLILHGGLDTTSTKADVHSIQSQMEASDVPCRLIIYDDDTHGLKRHRPEMFAEIFRFLAENGD